MKRAFSRHCWRHLLLAATAIATLPAFPAGAATDPTGDFLGTYGGPQDGGLDILDVSAVFDGNGYALTATLGGPPLTAPNSLLAWGINRGAGTARLMGGSPPVGPGVLFDSLLVLFGDGTSRTVVFNPAPPPTITPVSNWMISGNTVTGYAPLALLPSTGFDPANYTFSLWTRWRINPAFDTNNTEVADFGPTITAQAVPEPSTWALLILGFGAVGGAMRRRRVALNLSSAV